SRYSRHEGDDEQRNRLDDHGSDLAGSARDGRSIGKPAALRSVDPYPAPGLQLSLATSIGLLGRTESRSAMRKRGSAIWPPSTSRRGFSPGQNLPQPVPADQNSQPPLAAGRNARLSSRISASR